MNKAVVVSGCRTVVGACGGVFNDVVAIDLGGLVLRETLVRA